MLQEAPNVTFRNGLPVPRHDAVATEHGTLREQYGEHLAKLIMETGGIYGPIGLQYVVIPELRNRPNTNVRDPLSEGIHEVLPGLVYNYQGGITDEGIVRPGRALMTTSVTCAAYCAFCTRGDVVGQVAKGYKPPEQTRSLGSLRLLKEDQVDAIFDFYRNEPWINEVIISGGDFMLTPRRFFEHVIEGFARLQRETKHHPVRGQVSAIELVRIGTRVPMQQPELVHPWRYQAIAQLKNPKMMLHINHPDELTPETMAVLNLLGNIKGATLYSQSVLLRGVNAILKPGYRIQDQELEFEMVRLPDGREISVPIKDHSIDEIATINHLLYMFQFFISKNIIPFKLFQNDEVPWASFFTMPMRQARRVWQHVAANASGLAGKVDFVDDHGEGKIPMPKADVHDNYFRDFRGGYWPT